MTVTLYILGLLIRHGSMHGYQIMQTIEKHISDFAKIKTGNIYYHLSTMKKKGLVSSQVLTGQKSIEKTVYSITKRGEAEFNKLLKEAAGDLSDFEFMFDSVLFFREHINREELSKIIETKISSLEEKVISIDIHSKDLNKHMSDENAFYANAIFNHHIAHYKAELDWYKSLKEKLLP
jgi:DNA-binding PadR family transcriptional regulator